MIDDRRASDIGLVANLLRVPNIALNSCLGTTIVIRKVDINPLISTFHVRYYQPIDI